MDVVDSVRRFILENYLFTDDESELSNGESFMKKGIVDSTGMLEIINFLEEEFGVKVTDKEVIPENLDSVDSLVSYILRKTTENDLSIQTMVSAES